MSENRESNTINILPHDESSIDNSAYYTAIRNDVDSVIMELRDITKNLPKKPIVESFSPKPRKKTHKMYDFVKSPYTGNHVNQSKPSSKIIQNTQLFNPRIKPDKYKQVKLSSDKAKLTCQKKSSSEVLVSTTCKNSIKSKGLVETSISPILSESNKFSLKSKIDSNNMISSKSKDYNRNNNTINKDYNRNNNTINKDYNRNNNTINKDYKKITQRPYIDRDKLYQELVEQNNEIVKYSEDKMESQKFKFKKTDIETKSSKLKTFKAVYDIKIDFGPAVIDKMIGTSQSLSRHSEFNTIVTIENSKYIPKTEENQHVTINKDLSIQTDVIKSHSASQTIQKSIHRPSRKPTKNSTNIKPTKHIPSYPKGNMKHQPNKILKKSAPVIPRLPDVIITDFNDSIPQVETDSDLSPGEVR